MVVGMVLRPEVDEGDAGRVEGSVVGRTRPVVTRSTRPVMAQPQRHWGAPLHRVGRKDRKVVKQTRIGLGHDLGRFRPASHQRVRLPGAGPLGQTGVRVPNSSAPSFADADSPRQTAHFLFDSAAGCGQQCRYSNVYKHVGPLRAFSSLLPMSEASDESGRGVSPQHARRRRGRWNSLASRDDALWYGSGTIR